MRLATNSEILLDMIYKELVKLNEALAPAPVVEIKVEDIQPEQPKKALVKKKK